MAAKNANDSTAELSTGLEIEKIGDTTYVRLGSRGSELIGFRITGGEFTGKIEGYTDAQGEHHPAFVTLDNGEPVAVHELPYCEFDGRHGSIGIVSDISEAVDEAKQIDESADDERACATDANEQPAMTDGGSVQDSETEQNKPQMTVRYNVPEHSDKAEFGSTPGRTLHIGPATVYFDSIEETPAGYVFVLNGEDVAFVSSTDCDVDPRSSLNCARSNPNENVPFADGDRR